ncbi:MAG TPA: N-6 DNA methylase [Acidimicrobiales bacterium]|nr:N-6 DNA methylase [Acidimicrobiales bacterium]
MFDIEEVSTARLSPEGDPDPGVDYGEVFTRRWVVEFILDLIGYTPARDLGACVVVEPSCGTGAFLGPIVDRLLESCVVHGRNPATLTGAVRACDVLDANADRARKMVVERLRDGGLMSEDAEAVAQAWVIADDFLLRDHDLRSADYVVGNPPYVRLESVPRAVMAAYRDRCTAMRGRSDLYVGFVEVGLSLLKPGGALGFICADRWMHNQYGAQLRELVTADYAVETVVTMHDVPAFEDEVSAYPAIVVIRNADQADVAVVEAKRSFGEADAPALAAWASSVSQAACGPTFEASRTTGWFKGGELWPMASPTTLALVADLERRYDPLQDADKTTRVGIGVATGCDEVFITRDAALVEEDRLLPLLLASDTTSGAAVSSGAYLVNPWDEEGLVQLDAYPRLRDYLESHRARLERRHVARKNPAQWYRTIDRVDPRLLRRQKLLLPDLKAAAHPVFDVGAFYPHHNLYYVVSDTWDLEVLGGLLLSDIANLFVGAYCVKMRGGCYRFQAQYLRKIRVPDPGSVAPADRRELARVFRERDVDAATAIANRVYGIDELPSDILHGCPK